MNITLSPALALDLPWEVACRPEGCSGKYFRPKQAGSVWHAQGVIVLYTPKHRSHVSASEIPAAAAHRTSRATSAVA